MQIAGTLPASQPELKVLQFAFKWKSDRRSNNITISLPPNNSPLFQTLPIVRPVHKHKSMFMYGNCRPCDNACEKLPLLQSTHPLVMTKSLILLAARQCKLFLFSPLLFSAIFLSFPFLACCVSERFPGGNLEREKHDEKKSGVLSLCDRRT